MMVEEVEAAAREPLVLSVANWRLVG